MLFLSLRQDAVVETLIELLECRQRWPFSLVMRRRRCSNLVQCILSTSLCAESSVHLCVHKRRCNERCMLCCSYVGRMDENGDAEGNYTLLTRRPHHKTPGDFGLYPAGTFLLSGGGWPVRTSKFNLDRDFLSWSFALLIC